MESPAKTALGGGLISALAIGGMVVVGVTAGVVADPAAPPAGAAAGLVGFEDCGALKAWYVDHTLDQVGPDGWGGRGWPMAMRAGDDVMLDTATSTDPAASTAGAAEDAVSSSPTGTNTQEAGIDEPDVAKTDGRVVVRLEDGRRLVVTDLRGPAPRDVGSWTAPRNSHLDGLLLVGDHVLLSGGGPTVIDQAQDRSGTVAASFGTELVDLDLSDPTRPLVASRTSWSGRQLSLRQYGETVRLVTSTGLPSLPFVQPRPGRLTEDEAKERNRAIVRSSSVEDWVPGMTSDSGPGRLVGCDEVYHPTTWSGAETVAVATFRPGAVGSATAVAVTGAGDEVYSSANRLYVTSTDWGGRVLYRPMTGPGPISPVQPLNPARTHLHAFALDGGTTRYVASGVIDGTIRDRWSLDEYDGRLRVAVSWRDRRGDTRDNGIVVLEEKGGNLERVGQLRGLGVDEQIQSVRWFDALAVLVTFRQTDPLYTVDLSDPARPRELGALKIPGFSSYLHPIGGDRLLGLGTDATPKGRSLGAQAGVFDLRDPARTRQTGKVTFGRDSFLTASGDPHAFTWLPQDNAAITTLERWGDATDSPGLVLLRVAPSGAISTEDLPSPGGWQPRALPLPDGRVALVGSTVRIIDLDG